MAAVERLSVLYHSADYISFPLGSLGPCGIFENGVLLMYTLEGVSSVATSLLFNKTETPIFISVVCSLFPKTIFSCASSSISRPKDYCTG